MAVFSRYLFLILGLVVLLVGLGFLAKNAIDIDRLHAVAVSDRSAGFYNPLQQVLLMAGLTTVGGILTGLGLGALRKR